MAYNSSIRSDFNAASQIGYLKSVSRHKTDWDVISEAISIAYTSLYFQQRGLGTRVWNKYSDGFSEFYRLRGDFSKDSTLANLRAQPVDEKASVQSFAVHPETKKIISDIKDITGLQKDEDAISYALQLSYDLARDIQGCRGKAIVCCSNDVELRDSARQIKTSFDKTIGGKLRRAVKWF